MLSLSEDVDLERSRIDVGALNFVIVGGGATGVETAGVLADLIHDVMPERSHDLDVTAATITLVDHGDVVLAPFSDKAHAHAARARAQRRLLALGRSVTAVEADRVVFGDGTHLLSRCVVWAGGLKARSIAGLEALPNVHGRIAVGPVLAVDGFPGVYAVGDGAAALDADGHPFPPVGSVALQAGGAVAASVLAAIDGQPAPAFRYHDKGVMAMIGHGAAVAEMGKRHHELHGSIAFAAWLGVHAWLLSTTRARIDAFVNWAWDSFSNSRGPAIVDDIDTERIDWGDRDTEPEGGDMIENARAKVFWAVVVLTIACAVLTFVHSIWWLIGVGTGAALTAIGVWDLLQQRHSILRNYPIVGHLRFLLEDTGPELHQYLVENDAAGQVERP